MCEDCGGDPCDDECCKSRMMKSSRDFYDILYMSLTRVLSIFIVSRCKRKTRNSTLKLQQLTRSCKKSELQGGMRTYGHILTSKDSPVPQICEECGEEANDGDGCCKWRVLANAELVHHPMSRDRTDECSDPER